MLIIFAGLPGVGKTTIAKALSVRIGATYIRIDSIEGAMRASVLKIHPAEDAGYRVGYAIAEDNLRLGRTVVADSVNPIELTRTAWRSLSEKAACRALEIEVICSDLDEHRRRVEQRRIQGLEQHAPSWSDVIAHDYHAWSRERLIIDSARTNAADAVGVIERALERA